MKVSGAEHAQTSAVNVLPFQNKDQTLMHDKSFPPARNLGDETPGPEMGWCVNRKPVRSGRGAKAPRIPFRPAGGVQGCSQALPQQLHTQCWEGGRASGHLPRGVQFQGAARPKSTSPHETTRRCSKGSGVSHVASHRCTDKACTQVEAPLPGLAGCREPAAVGRTPHSAQLRGQASATGLDSLCHS